MGQPLAKQGDMIIAVDLHMVLVPAPPGPPVPTPIPHPFNGILNGNLSSNVMVRGMPAATVGSTADNTPPHIPTPPGISFVNPPTNKATITKGSGTVFINKKPAARLGDLATSCGEPPNSAATVVAAGNVMVGG
jgi:uncharacterized Zn-binding protein involved in type VI secretion